MDDWELYEVMPDEEAEKEDVRKPKELKKSTLFQRTSQVMRGTTMIGPMKALWPRFKHHYHVKKDEAGQHIYLEEFADQVIRYIAPQKVVDSIIEYWEQKTPWIFKVQKLSVTEAVAKECAKYWASISGSFEELIQPVLEKDFPGYCFHRLDFNFERGEVEVEKVCPAFTELFSRITNGGAFMAWIGSLFDAKSSRQQYVWLYGDGRNGKSTLGRILTKLMGPAARSEHPPSDNDKFWTYGLLGKRIVIFGDCNNFGYPNKGQFKALTGEDHIRIEIKNGPSYSAALNCKFLFFSNTKPDINGGESGKRRLIYCEVGAVTVEFGKDYEDRLWAEVPAFIGKCLQLYKEVTKDSATIPVDDSWTAGLIAETEARYEYFLKKHVNVHSEEASFANLELMTANQLQDKFDKEGIRDGRVQKNYTEYMERRYGIKKQRKGSGNREWYYTGCSAKIVSSV